MRHLGHLRVRPRWANLAVLVTGLGVAVYVLISPWGQLTGRALGPGFLPFTCGVLLAIVASVLVVRRWSDPETAQLELSSPALVMIGALVYIRVLTVEFVGATTVWLTLVSSVWMGTRQLGRRALYALCLSVVLYLAFRYLFTLPIKTLIPII